MTFSENPVEGDTLTGITVDTGLAYIAGNSILFVYNSGVPPLISFEAIVSYYNPSSGSLNIASITNINNSLVGTYLYQVNLTGQRGSLLFTGTGPPSINARIGDYYIDTEASLIYFFV